MLSLCNLRYRFCWFNLFLQAAEPLTHVLVQSTFRLSWFLLPEVVTDPNNALHSTNIYDEEKLKYLNNIYIDLMTKQFAGKMISSGQLGI